MRMYVTTDNRRREDWGLGPGDGDLATGDWGLVTGDGSYTVSHVRTLCVRVVLCVVCCVLCVVLVC